MKDDKTLFYDQYSRRYFEFDKNEIDKVNTLIFSHVLKYGDCTVNDLYEMIGLPISPNSICDNIGWSVDGVDKYEKFELQPMENDRGELYYQFTLINLEDLFGRICR